MKVYLERYSTGAEDTLGKLYINGTQKCFTLEDQPRKIKVKGDTRIPAGTYEIQFRKFGTHHEQYKVKFPDFHKGMLQLINVPGFDGILIHIGNTDADTAGCILVGKVTSSGPKPRRQLLASTLAYKDIYPPIAAALISGEKVFITIEDKG